MATQPAIVADRLTKVFGDFTAVDQVSFEVARGEVFGFLGPNGAGKSTTIRMLCGLLLPTSGRGLVAGFDVLGEFQKVKQVIGYMSQRFSLYDDLTVQENLTFFGGVYGLSNERLAERSRQVLELVGLSERRDEPTRNLGGGLKQRLALASAILHEPEVLFLDEPTSGVDPVSRRTFWDLIYDMAGRGVTVLVTTHYMDEAEFCDRLVLIFQARLIAQGSPGQLKRAVPEEIIALYPDPDRLGEALEVARKLPGVDEAAVFGDGLHVVSPEAGVTEAALKEALGREGITIRAMRHIEPTLEDAFISYIQRAGGVRR